MVLHSKRLTHHKMTESDRDEYLALVMHPAVMEFITGAALSEEDARIRFGKVLRTNEAFYDLGVFSVRTKADKQYAGLSKLTHLRVGVAEVGYALLPAFWGQGYATEITHTLIKMGRKLRRLHTLEAFINPENSASRHVLEKCGFELQQERIRSGLLTGIFALSLR